MNDKQEVEKLFRKSGLSISSREGLVLFDQLMEEYFVIDEIGTEQLSESIHQQFSPERMEKLRREIIQLKQEIFARAKPHDHNKRD